MSVKLNKGVKYQGLCAFRNLNPDVIGGYLPGWNIQQCIEGHPNYGKVLASVRTKKEAQKIVARQEIATGTENSK